jgi:two-component system, sensor histidine kinase and response regulator
MDTNSATAATLSADSSPRLAEDRAKVLLVDDQPDNLLSAEAVLESLGEEIVKAESGTEALRYLLDNDVAVILLDIMMPEMDGFETATLIRQRQRSRHIPIIFLTALGRGEEHIMHGYSLGAVDYIVKPFVPEILRSKVSVFVDLSRKSALLEKQAALLESRNEELHRAVAVQRRAEQEIHHLNQHLERRLGELAEVNRELEAFSYSVSHDLRAPLSRIAGFSKALLDFHAGQLDEKGREYLQRIDVSATRTCELVDDLLNFSRVTRAELRRENVNLTALVRGIAAELRNRDRSRQVEMVIAEGVEVSGDPGLLQSAILNLMENAWKFSSQRDPARIEFGVEYGTAGDIYFVKDNGAGFDMAKTQKLFTPFERLHSSAQFKGTGIGLAIVDRIVRRHGGRIWARGETGRGATFYFTLRPAAAEPERLLAASQSDLAKGATT